MKSRRRIWRTRHQVVALTALLACVGFGVVIYPLMIVFALHEWHRLVTLTIIIGNVVLVANVIIADRRAIRLLKRHDFKCCIPCGYPLSNLAPQGNCPECGEAYEIAETQHYWRSSYRSGFFFPLKP